MLSTSALTWAAAQDHIPVWELIRSLSPTDEARIEAAYAEWRRRAAAGEHRHKVDWHSYPVPDISPEDVKPAAEAVSAVVDKHVPETVSEPATADESEQAESEPTQPEPQAAETAPDIEEVVEEIMAVEDPEYISLDDFNLEPSEAEMKAMESALGAELKEAAAPAEEETVSSEAEEAEHTVEECIPDVVEPIPDAVESLPGAVEPIPDTGEPVEAEESAEQPLPIEQRISKLKKDATPSIYEDLLALLVGDIDTAKAVTEAVIKDHTRRHRGTAAQRQFLAWLNEK